MRRYTSLWNVSARTSPCCGTGRSKLPCKTHTLLAKCFVWPWTLTYQKFLLCLSSQDQDLYSHQKLTCTFTASHLRAVTTTTTTPDTTMMLASHGSCSNEKIKVRLWQRKPTQWLTVLPAATKLVRGSLLFKQRRKTATKCLPTHSTFSHCMALVDKL